MSPCTPRSAPVNTSSTVSSPTPASSSRPASDVPVHSAVPMASTSHGWLIARGSSSARPLPAHSSVTGMVDEARCRSSSSESSSGADRGVQGDIEQDYQRSLPLAEALRPEVLLAYEMNGRPLEPQHGFPLRLLVPGWYGMTSVKWLRSIEAVTEPFTGYQQTDTYRMRLTDEDQPGEPVSRIRVRALLIPPGIPDFLTRHRLVDAGTVALRGRAWCGTGPVARVEVAVDGDWADAELDEPLGTYAWRGWRWPWQATIGEHMLSCRATDAAGNSQPIDPPWNVQGMANNVVQRVPVTVR